MNFVRTFRIYVFFCMLIFQLLLIVFISAQLGLPHSDQASLATPQQPPPQQARQPRQLHVDGILPRITLNIRRNAEEGKNDLYCYNVTIMLQLMLHCYSTITIYKTFIIFNIFPQRRRK